MFIIGSGYIQTIHELLLLHVFTHNISNNVTTHHTKAQLSVSSAASSDYKKYSVFMQIGLRCCQYHFNHRIKVACIQFFLKDENIHSLIYHNYLFCFMGINVHTFRIVLNEKLAFTVIII